MVTLSSVLGKKTRSRHPYEIVSQTWHRTNRQRTHISQAAEEAAIAETTTTTTTTRSHDVQVDKGLHAGLIPVHSPLLRESHLISLPPLTDMLKFGG